MSKETVIKFGSPLVVILKTEQQKHMHAVVTLGHDDVPLTITGENMSETIQVGHIGTISVEWQDATGSPVKVDGPTTWASSDDTIITVAVAAGNPLIANWHTVGLGNAQLIATADADLGDGYKKVSNSTDFDVIPGEAVGGVSTVQDLGPGSPSEGGPLKK